MACLTVEQTDVVVCHGCTHDPCAIDSTSSTHSISSKETGATHHQNGPNSQPSLVCYLEYKTNTPSNKFMAMAVCDTWVSLDRRPLQDCSCCSYSGLAAVVAGCMLS
jgi:hypothetical protein